MPVLGKTLNLLENVTGGSSLVMAICQVFVPLCDPLAVGSYAIHLLKMLLFKLDRPKDWIDWVVEILQLFCFFIAVLLVCGICLPVLVMNIATVISLTLFSAAW